MFKYSAQWVKIFIPNVVYKPSFAVIINDYVIFGNWSESSEKCINTLMLRLMNINPASSQQSSLCARVMHSGLEQWGSITNTFF